jgi:lysophospholipase L1-like esterase
METSGFSETGTTSESSETRKLAKQPSSMKANILLMLVSLVVALVIAEIAVRVYYKLSQRTIYQEMAQQRAPNGSHFDLKDIIAPSDNPYLVYELIPNRRGMFQGVLFQTNAHGMRGPETTIKKGKGTWRIAALGDSTMFGWGVKQEQAYPAVLEKALNSAGDSWRYEVLNFAVPGYNTAIEAEVYKERAAAFDPDLILIQFDVNDLALPNFLFEPPDMLTLKRSYLLALIKSLLKGRDARQSLAQMASGELQRSPLIDAPSADGVVKYFEYRAQFAPEQYRYMVGWDGVRRALDRLWAESNQPILHLSWIYRISSKKLKDFGDIDLFAHHVHEGRARRNDGHRLFFLDIVSVGHEFCKELGLQWVRDLVVDYPNDYHPSPERHVLIARAIYLALVENRLLPKDSILYPKKEAIAQLLWDQAREMVESRATDPEKD